MENPELEENAGQFATMRIPADNKKKMIGIGLAVFGVILLILAMSKKEQKTPTIIINNGGNKKTPKKVKNEKKVTEKPSDNDNSDNIELSDELSEDDNSDNKTEE